MPSILETALRHNLDLCIQPYRVEVVWYDMALSETHEFTEDVNSRQERRAALKRCIDRAVKKAQQKGGV